MLIASALSTGCSAGKESSAPLASPPNLIADSGLNQASDTVGLARGVTSWGASVVTTSPSVAVPGTLAERVEVPAGSTGGVYIQLRVRPSTAYTQSAYLNVVSLDQGASAAMILEWYNANLRLLGYQMHLIDLAHGGYERKVQSARSPAGTALARFVVNVRGGGVVLFDAPQMETGIVATPFALAVPTSTTIASASATRTVPGSTAGSDTGGN